MNQHDRAREERPWRPGPGRKRWEVHLGWAASLFLVILGGKLWLIHHAATSLPLLDQWDGEGGAVFAPFLGGHLSLADLWRGHNEHRIVFTRLLDLGLLQLNHQWDNQLEIVVNAILHTSLLTGFGCWMAGMLGRACWPFIWLPIALAGVPPFAWENTLWGFQSTFYFLLLFSLLTLALLTLARPFTLRWWLGIAAGAASLFTMASGFLAVAAVVPVIVLEKIRLKSPWRGAPLATIAACMIILAAGILLMPGVPRHDSLHAQSPAEFLGAFARNLAWPLTGFPLFAVCNLVPILLLGWLYLQSGEKDVRPEKALFAIATWVTLQALAAAYARGAQGGPPPSRYMDLSSFTMISGCLASIMIVTRYRSRFLFRIGLGVWFAACLFGVWSLTDHARRIDIPGQQKTQEQLVQATRNFMNTGSPAALEGPDLQIPPLEKLLELLRNPDIRKILPACVQPDAPSSPVGESSHEQGGNPSPHLPSAWAVSLAARWKWLLALGIIGMFLTLGLQVLKRPEGRAGEINPALRDQ